MNTIYCQSENYEITDKQKPETPLTADSCFQENFKEKLGTNNLINQLFSFWGNRNLFMQSEDRFLGLARHSQIESPEEEVSLKVEQTLSECDLRICLELKEKQEHIKTKMMKQIYRIMEDNKFITLIFDRQYQKFELDYCGDYELSVFFETQDGFRRNIWNHLIYCEKSSDSDFLVFENEQGFKLNSEFCEAKKHNIKPLCLRIPIDKFQAFYDQKFKLLNKSDILNSIQAITLLQGILYPLTKQNMGSRIIQKLLGKASEDQIIEVIHELKPHLSEMVTDQYGNYVLQKIFKVSQPQIQKKCLQYISGNLVGLIMTKAGTHCIQQILKHLNNNSIAKIGEIVAEKAVQIGLNQYGYHFLQKFLEIFTDPQIIQKLLDSFEALAVNKYGIVVMKTVMRVCANNQYYKCYFLENCLSNINQVSFQQYGHYIIIELFKYYNYYQLIYFSQHIIQYVQAFSQNSFSSNIISKLIKNYGDYISVPMIDQLLSSGVQQLMESSSGCYVLHRLIENTKDDSKKHKLLKAMIEAAPQLNNYEKRNKWIKFFDLH